MGARVGVAAVCATLLFMSVPAAADHQQDVGWDDQWIVFDHVKGNEWWVEVDVDSSWTWDVVAARDDGGDWVSLEKRSWGVWAGSFHIEPGHRVQFQALHTPSGGPDSVQSCWFTHPGGVEQCESVPADPVAFDHTGGNEWWVQVDVQGGPSRVESQDTGGAWVGLEKKSWGDWAASYHIEPGHEVRFRALVDGDWVVSCWFTHPGGKTPDGGAVCGEGSAPPPDEEPGGFDASFDPKPGNEWWVEVYVDANSPLAGVDARDDAGPWIALEKKSWGAWAKSFHVEDGSIVEFRARATDGSTDVSGGYRWPEATQVSSEPDPDPDPDPEPSTVDVAFGPKAGNEWWVEAIIVGDGENITAAEARAEGGGWHQLTYRDWGAWAASFHVPPGSHLQLRATTQNGTDESAWFTWPDARPVGSDGSWPEEGSYARVDSTTQHAPGIYTQLTIDHVYHDGVWWTHSEGWFDHDSSSEEAGRSPEWGWSNAGPVMCDPDARPGDQTCGLTVVDQRQEDTHQEGDPVTVATWYGEDIADCNCNNDYGEWDQATGIQIGFHNSGTSWHDRLLLDTDAPMQTL